MRLESLVQENVTESYQFTILQTIRFESVIRGIVDDLLQGVHSSIIASKFHNTIISVIFEAVKIIRQTSGVNKVVLSGGVFQNKYLLEGTIALLEKNSFDVFAHAGIPSNDGGLALGQLIIAAKRRSLICA
jgi:hydrogenase maturation protein HypF